MAVEIAICNKPEFSGKLSLSLTMEAHAYSERKTKVPRDENRE